MAMETYKKIEKNIADSYSVLGNEEDTKLFYDYLITNLKLYFDKFEEEMGVKPETEPTTPEYEQQKKREEEQDSGSVEEMPEDYYPDRPWGIGNNPLTALNKFLQSNHNYKRDDRWSRRSLMGEFRDGIIYKLAT